MRRIRVVVTAEDIANGQPSVNNQCAVARALHRTGYPRARVFSVTGSGYPEWTPDGGVHIYRGSWRLMTFLNRFDHLKPVQPATFYLEGPDR